MRPSPIGSTAVALASFIVLAFAGTARAQLPWEPPARRGRAGAERFGSLTRTTQAEDGPGAMPAYRTDVTITADGRITVTGRSPAGGGLRAEGTVGRDTLEVLHAALAGHRSLPARIEPATAGPQTRSFALDVADRDGRRTTITGGSDWTGPGAGQLTVIMHALDRAVERCVGPVDATQVAARVAATADDVAWLVTPGAHYRVVPRQSGVRLFPLLGQQVSARGRVRSHGAWFPFSGDLTDLVTTRERTGDIAGTILDADGGGLALRTADGAVVPLTGGDDLHPILARLTDAHVLLNGTVIEDLDGHPLLFVASALGVRAVRPTILSRAVARRIEGPDLLRFPSSNAPLRERRQVDAGARLWITGRGYRVVLPGTAGTWLVGSDSTLSTDIAGVVRVARANLRAGPGTSEAIVGALPRGAEVVVLEVHDGWLRVASPDVASAWISGGLVERDAPASGETRRDARSAVGLSSELGSHVNARLDIRIGDRVWEGARIGD